MSSAFPSYDEVKKVREQLSNVSYLHWVNNDFLTWKWWFDSLKAIT